MLSSCLLSELPITRARMGNKVNPIMAYYDFCSIEDSSENKNSKIKNPSKEEIKNLIDMFTSNDVNSKKLAVDLLERKHFLMYIAEYARNQ